MGKFQRASDDVKKLFNEVLTETTIPNWIEFEVLCNNKQKDVYKMGKLNDLVETLTDGLNFTLVINEEIFDGLNIEQQKMLIHEALAGINISESDTVSYEKPNFTTYRGVLQKFGHDKIITLKESVKSLFDEKKQREDEARAMAKQKRGRKKNI